MSRLRWLIPALLDRRDARARRGRRASSRPFVGHRMAKAGLELAVLDAALRAEGRPLGEYLGAVRDRVPSGRVASASSATPRRSSTPSRGYLDEGYVRIKIKIKPGRDVADTAAVRDAFGAIPLQVDANSAYTLADVDTLAELDRFDLLLIEQPLQEDDLVDHATLARHLRTPVCLDESIVSAKAAADALALGAASVINIKAGPRRRLSRGRARSTICAGMPAIPVWCGGMLETGIGRAANAALAALPGLHAARRRLGVEPLLPPRHRHRAGRARGRARARADRSRARRRDRPGRARRLHGRPRGGAGVDGARPREPVGDTPRRAAARPPASRPQVVRERSPRLAVAARRMRGRGLAGPRRDRRRLPDGRHRRARAAALRCRGPPGRRSQVTNGTDEPLDDRRRSASTIRGSTAPAVRVRRPREPDRRRRDRSTIRVQLPRACAVPDARRRSRPRHRSRSTARPADAAVDGDGAAPRPARTSSPPLHERECRARTARGGRDAVASPLHAVAAGAPGRARADDRAHGRVPRP